MPKLFLKVDLMRGEESLIWESADMDTLAQEVEWEVVPRIGETVMLTAILSEAPSSVHDVEVKVENVTHYLDCNEIILRFNLKAQDYLYFTQDDKWVREDGFPKTLFESPMAGVHMPGFVIQG